MPFRFLDLPAEMRNRIYDRVADLIAETPILIANRKEAEKETPKPGLAGCPDSHEQILCDLAKLTNRRNVFALLLVCRQITHEARTIIDEAVGRSGLDLRFVMLKSSLQKMKQLQESWAPKLSLIRHLTVNHQVFCIFIWTQTNNDFFLWKRVWTTDYGSEDNAEHAHRLGKLLPNIENLTVHTMINGLDGTRLLHCGEKMVSFLAQAKRVSLLHQAFPRLVDLKCLSKLDGQRLKNENGVWRS